MSPRELAVRASLAPARCTRDEGGRDFCVCHERRFNSAQKLCPTWPKSRHQGISARLVSTKALRPAFSRQKLSDLIETSKQIKSCTRSLIFMCVQWLHHDDCADFFCRSSKFFSPFALSFHLLLRLPQRKMFVLLFSMLVSLLLCHTQQENLKFPHEIWKNK